ncbi:MAG: hypothetical protein CMF22_10205 [Idiomarinaceae bacterium]|nr:hypothetical protein [Idiomarinaceae bacterium]MBG23814.1 hypothetical protein [Idiomarinaceae bacterium]
MKTDKEIVDSIYKLLCHSLVEDVPSKKKEFDGPFAEGYITCMETTARFFLKYIDEQRGE